MRRLSPLLLALAVAGLSLGLAACGDDDDGGGGGGETSLDLVIGDIVPLTGDLSPFGPPGQKAADIAVEEINSAIQEAGVDHTVTISHEDEQTDPQAAVQAARKLVADGASCITGAWASSDSIPVARSVSVREGVLQISPASTSTEITGLEDNGLMNRTPPADNLQGPALAGLIAEEIAPDATINVGSRNDSYGTGLVEQFRTAWEAQGGSIGEELAWDPKAATYDSEAEQLVSGNPDAIVIVDFPETFVKFAPALERTGSWDPGITFITDGLASSSLLEDPGADVVEGIRGTAPGTPTEGAPSEAFDELYTSSPPQNVERQTFDAQNFDAVILCYLAAVAAGSTDGEDMAAELQAVSGPGGDQYTWEQLPEAIEALQNGDDIDYVGAAGDINLDENGDPTVGVYDRLVYEGDELTTFGEQIPAEESS